MTLHPDDLPPGPFRATVARTWRDDIPGALALLAVFAVFFASILYDPWLIAVALIGFAFTGGEWR